MIPYEGDERSDRAAARSGIAGNIHHIICYVNFVSLK